MPSSQAEPVRKAHALRAIERKRYSLGRSAEPPSPATIIATLRCKIVAVGAVYKLADALPAD